MEWIFTLVPLVFCFAIPLVLILKDDGGVKNKNAEKIANIEKKLDRIIELLEKEKGA